MRKVIVFILLKLAEIAVIVLAFIGFCLVAIGGFIAFQKIIDFLGEIGIIDTALMVMIFLIASLLIGVGGVVIYEWIKNNWDKAESIIIAHDRLGTGWWQAFKTYFKRG